MAHIGMKYVVAAPLKNDETYDPGYVVAKAIEFTGTPNTNSAVLYADDGSAETDQAVSNMGTSLNVDDVSLEVQGKLLGHTYTASSGETPEGLVINADDVAPYVGMGFYKRRRKNGVTSFTVIWLNKVQNTAMTENAATKGETTEFQTDTIEGTSYPLSNGAIYEKHVLDTEAKAKTWLNTKAGITGNTGNGGNT